MPEGFESACALLTPALRQAALRLPETARSACEELRLRAGYPPAARLPEGELALCPEPVVPETLAAVLERATGYSLHACAEELRRGYVCAPGGVRVGVCGAASEGAVRAVRDVSSLCIRVPRQIFGAGAAVLPRLWGQSVLIVSPPGGGKTSFLRELVRTTSDAGTRVALVDERGELAGMAGGVPRFDVGRCTDVLSGAPKGDAALRLLRAMGPEVVAMDEISDPADAAAIETLLGCGVRVFATAHAADVDSLRRRAVYRRLLELGAFERVVRISGSGRDRRYTVRAP